MINVQEVSKTYYVGANIIQALSDVSFQIEKGEFVSIVGKSGAGKSTLIRLLIGEETPSLGSILFKGINIQEMSPVFLQDLRRQIGVIYQDYKLLNSKTVRENVEYIMQVIGASDKDIQRDVPMVLEMVDLISREENFPCQLSGGEKQRLAIARALCHRPKVVVADEPTGNLDLYNSWQVINLLKKINSLGATVILATHDKEIIDGLEKRVITLEDGRLVRDEAKGKFIL